MRFVIDTSFRRSTASTEIVLKDMPKNKRTVIKNQFKSKKHCLSVTDFVLVARSVEGRHDVV